MGRMILDVLERGTCDMPFRSTTITAATGALLTILALSAFGQNSNVRADAKPAAVESVKKFETELCELLVRGEWDSYAGHLTDDYVRIIPGKIQGKEEVLEGIPRIERQDDFHGARRDGRTHLR